MHTSNSTDKNIFFEPMAMAKLVFLTSALVWVSLIVCQINGLPTSDEELYYGKELNRELTNCLSSLTNAQSEKNSCRSDPANGDNARIQKRNSEIVNTILGLPMDMYYAG